MIQTFSLWFDRLLSSARPAALVPSSDPQPMKIEVERLPDYLWRELGFRQPQRDRE